MATIAASKAAPWPYPIVLEPANVNFTRVFLIPKVMALILIANTLCMIPVMQNSSRLTLALKPGCKLLNSQIPHNSCTTRFRFYEKAFGVQLDAT